MPSLHGVLARSVLRIVVIRRDDLIQNTGDYLSGILLELHHQIRQHTMQPSASGIVASASWNPEPIRDTVFVPKNPFAVIAVA
jgi:hypothetical protein